MIKAVQRLFYKGRIKAIERELPRLKKMSAHLGKEQARLIMLKQSAKLKLNELDGINGDRITEVPGFPL